ncbi:3'(2'),5'-bisphosphate nucleotidase [hydrothermal vent metagenome]|uniref:3'-phosphoadenosine 5'-phosphate phosphatase n=1 Tax=hydrothermal vent metagenome TaxID=652676 RepID=A0A3B1CGW9_9ZZZZ
MSQHPDLISHVIKIAGEAGAAIMDVYHSEDLGATVKDDNSPLTRADLASNEIIVNGLAGIYEGVPIMTEEAKADPYEIRKGWGEYWCIDPLDGTKEFVKRRDEFTVNIALMENGHPKLGVVHAPVTKDTYWAMKGVGAFKETGDGEKKKIKVADYRAEKLKVIASRSHGSRELEDFIERLGSCERLSFGSSLKFCKVAEGSAHIYPRFGPTMEWDTAAAQIVVEEAGGHVTDFNGRQLRYNKEDLHNPYFMVTGNPPYPWRELL